MKALSIRQPWAWLIVQGHKDIENRTWSTGTRGPVLIHASKGMTQTEYEDVCAFLARDPRLKHLNAALPAPADLERGGIIGRAEIVDCVKHSLSPWFMGEFGFVIRNATPLPFRAFSGALQFFDVPEVGKAPGQDVQPLLF
jgi:hypothetical protein